MTMTTATETLAGDHRGSWIPTGAMISPRILELRKRRGLMIALVVVNIGIPSLFLLIRLIAHAVAPKSYGPAGGYDIFTTLTAGVMFIFGYIVAATLGATAGSVDLAEGMFRHLVVTGRSRLALYLARIPAGLAIVIPIVLAGFAIVCAACVFAAPTKIDYNGATIPAGLSEQQFTTWAVANPNEVLCNFNFSSNIPSVLATAKCGNHGQVLIGPPGSTGRPKKATQAQIDATVAKIAEQNYAGYKQIFLTPPFSLMVRTFLWLALEATIGLIVGLGFSSLIGQRTIAVITMIVVEIILTPILSRHVIAHVVNLQRILIVGLAMAHIEPAGLPSTVGGGGPGNGRILVPESITVAWIVIVCWLVGWTALGAWRMMTRDV